jgi:hypothetical protein
MQERLAMTAQVTEDRVTVSTRLLPETVAEIEQMRLRANEARQKAGKKPIRSKSEMLDWLLGFAIEEVREQASKPQPQTRPRLNRTEYACRAEGLVEAMSDLLVRIESHDPDGAIQLSKAIAKSTTAYSEDLEQRYTT